MMSYNFTTFPVLKTERLFLRALSFTDIEMIYALRSDKKVNALITRKTPKNLEDAKEFITICHQEFNNKNRIFWAIESEEKIIGTIVYHKIVTENNYAEIGYELNPVYQQKGFMSEAMKLVLEFGFKQMKLKIIEAFTHKNNVASITLLEKHNFIYQPHRKCSVFEYNRIFKLVNN